jgi:hypothetical protein
LNLESSNNIQNVQISQILGSHRIKSIQRTENNLKELNKQINSLETSKMTFNKKYKEIIKEFDKNNQYGLIRESKSEKGNNNLKTLKNEIFTQKIKNNNNINKFERVLLSLIKNSNTTSDKYEDFCEKTKSKNLK